MILGEWKEDAIDLGRIAAKGELTGYNAGYRIKCGMWITDVLEIFERQLELVSA